MGKKLGLVAFELNHEGVRELLRGEPMQELLTDYARQVEARAGDGYEVTTHVGKNRANASVHAVSRKALRDTFDNNALLKALGR